MSQNRFPPGWDEERVRRLIERYESQTEDEAVAEDEAAIEDASQTLIEVPNELVHGAGHDREAQEGELTGGRGAKPAGS